MKITHYLFAAFLLIVAHGAGASPLLFHEHGHGLAYSPDGKALLAPSDRGLAAYEDGLWWTAEGPPGGFSAFSASEHALFSSGHSKATAGLLRSLDGGRRWHAVALAGAADFRHLAAGFRSKAIYVLNVAANAALPHVGLHRTPDEGKSWLQPAAKGLDGEIHAIAAHPDDGLTVAIGTDRGLYLSRDGGERFTRIDRRGAIAAVTFSADGTRLLYASATQAVLLERPLAGSKGRETRLPMLRDDYVTCLAQNPLDTGSLAFATRRREVYVSPDGGATWRRITDEPDLR